MRIFLGLLLEGTVTYLIQGKLNSVPSDFQFMNVAYLQIFLAHIINRQIEIVRAEKILIGIMGIVCGKGV